MLEKRHNSKRGSAAVELALMGTLLMMITFGAADFARIFYDAVAVTNAAGAAAFYGADDNVRAGDYAAITGRVRVDAEPDVGAVTPVITQICNCPGVAPFPCINYVTTVCAGGYGAPRAYVKVEVTEPFESISNISLLPNGSVEREAWMRVR